MISGYFGTSPSDENTKARRRRVMAVSAALEVIKASVSTATNARNTEYELQQAIKHLSPLADAIQAAVEKE